MTKLTVAFRNFENAPMNPGLSWLSSNTNRSHVNLGSNPALRGERQILIQTLIHV
jgi:hypothetical protein